VPGAENLDKFEEPSVGVRRPKSKPKRIGKDDPAPLARPRLVIRQITIRVQVEKKTDQAGGVFCEKKLDIGLGDGRRKFGAADPLEPMRPTICRSATAARQAEAPMRRIEGQEKGR